MTLLLLDSIWGARGLHSNLPEGRVHKELAKGFSNHFTECVCACLDVNPGQPVLQALGEEGEGSGWVLVFRCVSRCPYVIGEPCPRAGWA